MNYKLPIVVMPLSEYLHEEAPSRSLSFMNRESYLSSYEGKTILITGGAGAIGSNLTRALIAFLDLIARFFLRNFSRGRTS